MTSGALHIMILLGAAIIAVPLFRRFGLGSVLGYLVAGVLVGPQVFAWFTSPSDIVHVAELGVVMFLFVIGLEMRPSHLWSMRRDIFGLGMLQVITCSVMLTLVGLALGASLSIAIIGAWGFVLTSTAVVVQVLEERGDLTKVRGKKILAILLLEDMMIVPLLAAVSLMSPGEGGFDPTGVIVAAGCIAALIAAGVWLLEPLFRLLALARAREVMTAAALFVVLGAAALMHLGGLSMAMGAFMAGVLLSESSFRNQIEADIEPFKGILMGLFFLGVGMSLDLYIVSDNWLRVISAVIAMAAAKAAAIYITARVMGSRHPDALDRSVLMAQGGEFAFVLFAAAVAGRVISPETGAILTSIIIVSMAVTPLVSMVMRTIVRSRRDDHTEEGPSPEEGGGSVLLIGFGRFGQVVGQSLLTKGIDVTIIDSDPNRIQAAHSTGFKVYYGDGSRLDVLSASGAAAARAIAICVDDRDATTRIVGLCHAEFPHARILARSYDRTHALGVMSGGAHYQVRETFESALVLGTHVLLEMGIPAQEADEIADEVRHRDQVRFEAQLDDAGGIGRDMLHGDDGIPLFIEGEPSVGHAS